MTQEVKRKVLTGWDMLIQDASRQIDAAKQRIALLKKTLKNLERVRDSGQPWPGTQSADQSQEQNHSV